MQRLDFELDKAQVKRAWGVIDREFQSLGLVLRRGSDFDLVEAMAAESGFPPLEGHFTPTLNTYTPSQAFWLALTDKDGKMVGRVCARFDRMEYPMTLTDFWRKYFHRCYPNAVGGQVVLEEDQPRVGRRITGDVVYLGGTYVAREWRRHKLGGLLNQLAQIEALHDWGAGFYYGWIQGHTFLDGFWRECGFTRCSHHALRWAEPLPGTLDANLIFAGNSVDDVCDLIDRVARGFPVIPSDRIFSQSQTGSQT